jgi:hypothetical protein
LQLGLAKLTQFFTTFTKVKLEKVDIMCMLVSDKNFDQVLLELKEWPVSKTS